MGTTHAGDLLGTAHTGDLTGTAHVSRSGDRCTLGPGGQDPPVGIVVHQVQSWFRPPGDGLCQLLSPKASFRLRRPPLGLNPRSFDE